MVQLKKLPSDEVDAMIRNAELRSELEPYQDDSIDQLTQSRRIPLDVENEYLEMMLAWEEAPVLPIAQWFNPPLQPKDPDSLTPRELAVELHRLVYLLYGKQLVLDFTDHLSDRELYLLICRDILPSKEKMLAIRNGYLHWDCAGMGESQETWLRYYALDEERELWEEMNGRTAPAHQDPPYPREMPVDPT
ncbi:MAG: hypothetical protein Q4D98_09425 [Planctomycetia bacterium]|nr:hypothetical protein [Planctomycetia bacterium]